MIGDAGVLDHLHGMLELVRAIEAKVGVSLPPILLFEHETIRDLAAHLAKRYAGELEARQRAPRERSDESAREVIVSVGVNTRSRSVVPAAQPRASSVGFADVAIIGISGRFPGAGSVEEFWENLAEAVGQPDMLQRPEFESRPARIANYEKVVEFLAPIFATQPRKYWEERLASLEVPHSPVYTSKEVVEGELAQHHKLVIEGEGARGRFRATRSPGAKVSSGGRRPRTPSSKRSASGAVPAQRTTPACTPRR